MAQRKNEGVPDDVVKRFGDWSLRAVVVGILLVRYVAWLEHSPIPAIVFGGVVAGLICAWRRVPWAIDDGRESRRTDGPRTTAIADVDLMTCREFQQLIARLMRRDSCVGVRALGLRDDLSTDVVGQTPSGHNVVVQCNRDAAHRRVDTPEVQRFLGTLGDQHSAGIAVFVTTGRFTRSAMALGEDRDVLLLDRSQVATWLTGRTTALTPYLTAAG